MPIYEYQCQGCSKVFEEMVLPGKPEPMVCRACGAEIARVISAPSFHLKGGGWYVSDYKKSVTPSPSAGPSETPSTPATPAPVEDVKPAPAASDISDT